MFARGEAPVCYRDAWWALVCQGLRAWMWSARKGARSNIGGPADWGELFGAVEHMNCWSNEGLGVQLRLGAGRGDVILAKTRNPDMKVYQRGKWRVDSTGGRFGGSCQFEAAAHVGRDERGQLQKGRG